MSRWLRFLPLVVLLAFVGAVAWRLRQPGRREQSARSWSASRCRPSRCRRRCPASRAWRRPTSPAASRACSTSSPAGACRASPKRRCSTELKRRGVRDRRIAIRDRPEDVAAFLARHGDPFERIGADDDSRVQLALGSSGVPESFVVDGRGIIRYQHIGPIEPDDVPTILRELEKARVRRCLLLLRSASPRAGARRQRSLPPAHGPTASSPTRARKPRPQALMEELRCLVCQGQSIADSDAELAGDMRAPGPQRIAAGESPRQVRAWLVERYGDWVSYRPPVEPVDLAAVGRAAAAARLGALLVRKRIRLRRAMSGWLIARWR